jgi:hypothetical protein
VIEGRGRGVIEKNGQLMDDVAFGLIRDDLK